MGVLIQGTKSDNNKIPFRSSSNGSLSTSNILNYEYLEYGYATFASDATAGTYALSEITKPDVVYDKYLLTIGNVSDSAMTAEVFNTMDFLGDGTTRFWSVIDELEIEATHTTSVSATAWTSCFVSIGGVLSDYSADLADTYPPSTGDVPFDFTAVDDAIYFGTSVLNNGFSLYVGTAGVYNASGVWEYYNGSEWTTLTVRGVTPTTPFKMSGLNVYSFVKPDDMSTVDPTGSPLEEYWIRFRITSFTSRTTSPIFWYGRYYPYGVSDLRSFVIDNLFAGDLGGAISFKNTTTLDEATDVNVYWILTQL